MPSSPPFAIIDFPGSGAPAGGWSFSCFDEVHIAESLDDVAPVLERVDAAVMAGCWAVGYLAYEAAPGLDPSLQVQPSGPDDPPLAWWGISKVAPSAAEDLPLPRRAVGYGSGLTSTFSSAPHYRRYAPAAALDESAYLAAFARIRRCLIDGESYQVNATFPLDGVMKGDLGALFEDLRRAQFPAYSAWLHLPRHDILSASPELFFERRGDTLRTRPMKGTRRRAPHPVADARAAEELLASDKERAENVMIVDLLRNDLGRLAELGSVRVPELFHLERYPTVWQLTSTVEATLRPDTRLPAILRALFPCGSVTGAPKVHTMGIIAREEPAPRGVYCGAIGLIQPGGDAVFSVGIRTLTVQPDGRYRYPVGSGLTIDADGPTEYRECLAKAGVLQAASWPVFELLEALLYTPADGIWLLDRHLDRLAASAHWFDRAMDPAAVRAALLAAVKGHPAPAKVRLLLGTEGAPEIELHPLGPPQGPEKVRLGPIGGVFSQDPFLYHKTTHRAVYDTARSHLDGADDVLLRNERGELTESTRANLALRINGEWLTPAIDSGLLAGTLRAERLAAGELREAVLTAADLPRADALQLFNSLRGTWPVTLLAD